MLPTVSERCSRENLSGFFLGAVLLAQRDRTYNLYINSLTGILTIGTTQPNNYN